MFTVLNELWVVVLSFIIVGDVEDGLFAVAVLKALWNLKELNVLIVDAIIKALFVAFKDISSGVLDEISEFLLVNSQLELVV